MNQRSSWFKGIKLLGLMMLISMLAGCSSDNSSKNSTESLNIYEVWATSANFTAVTGDETARKFQLTLSNQFTEEDAILYFSNRGAQQAGTTKLGNLINNIWPRVYGSVAPNALLQGKTATNETVYISCILEKPLLNKATGQLSFSITYLDGQRPAVGLALTDLDLVITNNSATVQPAVWSHNLDGDSATLELAKNADGTIIDGTYILRLQKAFGSMLGITCAPQRKTETITTKSYFDGWSKRFGTNSPNVSISYTNSSLMADGGVFTATLSNPVYDEKTGSVSFTAKNLYSPFGLIGKTALTIKEPTLFIDAGPGSEFPTFADNVFSIQFRNSTSDSILVWLAGKRPPCSQAQADNCDVSDWNDSQKFKSNWESKAMQDAFAASGTRFYKVTPGTGGNKVESISVTTQIELAAGQILRIVPPTSLKNGVLVPEWYFKDEAFNEKHESLGKKVQTAGANAWVTNKVRSGAPIYMPAPEPVLLYEFFPAPQSADGTPPTIWYDMSGVDGINAKATMTYEGIVCGPDDKKCIDTISNLYKKCAITLEEYTAQNVAGCPKSMVFANANTCPNPKKYAAEISSTVKPDWVIGTDSFSIADLQDQLYKNILSAANAKWGKPLTGLDLASAASDQAAIKPAYHIWWSTNPVGQGWLKYLQANNGRCDAYGWAYDEKKWLKGQSLTFDTTNGNPINEDGTNRDNPLKPLVSYPYVKDTYLNIDILQVM